jgi:hypothetical protein
MTSAELPAATSAVPSTGGEEVHDEHHVHVYETSGIAEGNARVPRWLVAVVVTLLSFFVWYIATQWSAQPSTARMKSS